MEKLTITKLVRKEKDSKGNLYKWPSGDTYIRMGILTREYGGDVWFSCAVAKWNENMKEGDVIEVDIEHSADGKWHNIKRPDPLKALEARVLALEKAILLAFRSNN